MAQATWGFRAFAALRHINTLEVLIEFLDTGSLCSLDNALTSGPFLSVSPQLWFTLVNPLSIFFNRTLTERSRRAVEHRQVMLKLTHMNIALDDEDIQRDIKSAYEYTGCIHFWSFRFRRTITDHKPLALNGQPLRPRIQLQRATPRDAYIEGVTGWDGTGGPYNESQTDGNFPRLPWCPDTFLPLGYVWCDTPNVDIEFAFREVPVHINRRTASEHSGVFVALPSGTQASSSSSSGSQVPSSPFDPFQ